MSIERPHGKESAAQHAASITITREIVARQNAHEAIIETLLAIIFGSVPLETQRAVTNDLFARRAALAEHISEGNGAHGIDAELHVATDLHLARIMKETAAIITASSIGQIKN